MSGMSALRARLDSHAAASSSMASSNSCTFKYFSRRPRAPFVGRTHAATSTSAPTKSITVSAAQQSSEAKADSWFFTETGQKSWVSLHSKLPFEVYIRHVLGSFYDYLRLVHFH